MAHMPVEVIDIGDIPLEVLTQGLTLANSLQNEFFFDRLPETDGAQFRMLSFTESMPLTSWTKWRRSVHGSRVTIHS